MAEQGTPIYRVSGNLDQIKKHGLDKEYNWEPRTPAITANSVSVKFTDKMDACDLYNKMNGLKIVAFRNWLD